MAAKVAQPECSNNKCYASAFRYKYRLCLLNSNIILKQFVSSDIVIMS